MDLVFTSTFDNQSMSIGRVGELGHLFGLFRHYLLMFIPNSLLLLNLHIFWIVCSWAYIPCMGGFLPANDLTWVLHILTSRAALCDNNPAPSGSGPAHDAPQKEHSVNKAGMKYYEE